MDVPHLLSGVQLLFWLISFILWVLASYHRNYNTDTSDMKLSARINPFNRRHLYSSNKGFLYQIWAYIIFATGALSGIISNFIR